MGLLTTTLTAERNRSTSSKETKHTKMAATKYMCVLLAVCCLTVISVSAKKNKKDKNKKVEVPYAAVSVSQTRGLAMDRWCMFCGNCCNTLDAEDQKMEVRKKVAAWRCSCQ